jgi:hypothetical protein
MLIVMGRKGRVRNRKALFHPRTTKGLFMKDIFRVNSENPTIIRFLYGMSLKTGLNPKDVICEQPPNDTTTDHLLELKFLKFGILYPASL